MQVTLPKELQGFVNKSVKSGAYKSGNDVVKKSLRLLKKYQIVRANKLKKLRAKMQRSLNQIKNGECQDGDEVFAEIAKKHNFKL